MADRMNDDSPQEQSISLEENPMLKCEPTSAEEFIRSEHAKYAEQSIENPERCECKDGTGSSDHSDTLSTDTTEGADPPDFNVDSDIDSEHEKESEEPCASRPETLPLSNEAVAENTDVSKPLIPGVAPLYVEGNSSKQGEMVSFVASNLEEKIRLSSPVLKDETATPGSGWSIPSSIYSSCTNSPTRQYHPDNLPPIDPSVLTDIEHQSYKIADSLHLIMGGLSTQLHNMSALTVGCLQTYRDMVHKSSDNIDSSIKSMYALMAKCEELSKEMEPVYKMQHDIKEINRLLDVFEDKIDTFPSSILKP